MQKKREFGILLEKAVIGLLFEVEGDILVKYRGRQKEVIIPDGIREIGRDAFSYNRYIRRVVIPEGVRVIAGSAFITSSVPPRTKVTVKSPELTFKGPVDSNVWE